MWLLSRALGLGQISFCPPKSPQFNITQQTRNKGYERDDENISVHAKE
jgi:hypothetical protein